MVIVQAMNEMLPRFVADQLAAHLRTMPAVVVTGARQTGKSTLAQAAGPARRYVSLDDLDALDAARREPDLLLAGDAPLTLDEVQRCGGVAGPGRVGGALVASDVTRRLLWWWPNGRQASTNRARSMRSMSKVLIQLTPTPVQTFGILTFRLEFAGSSRVTTVWPAARACPTRW